MTATKSIYEYLYGTQNRTLNFKKLGNIVYERNLFKIHRYGSSVAMTVLLQTHELEDANTLLALTKWT